MVLPDCIKQEGRVSLKFVALEMLIFCGLVFVAGWQLQSLQTALGILGGTRSVATAAAESHLLLQVQLLATCFPLCCRGCSGTNVQRAGLRRGATLPWRLLAQSPEWQVL